MDNHTEETPDLRSVHERLERIMHFMERELASKQHGIEALEVKVGELNIACEEKNALIGKLDDQLSEYRQTGEGTRQLINKLLNDIGNYQKDLDWYKRTYVKRSLVGTIWQKLFRK